MPTLRQAYSTYPGNAQTGVAVVVGDLIVVGYTYGAAVDAACACTDNAAGGTNTYNQAGTGQAGPTTDPSSGATTGANVFYAIAKASETLTITCTTKNDAGISVHVVRDTRLTLADVLDDVQSSRETANSTLHTAASVTASGPAYLFVLWFEENTSSALAENGTNFTERTEQSTHVHGTYDRCVTGAGSYADAMTSVANTGFANIAAAFKGPLVATGPAPLGWFDRVLKAREWF
jgi:hypothetical protein